MSDDTPTLGHAAFYPHSRNDASLGKLLPFNVIAKLQRELTAAQAENAELRAKCERLGKRNELLTIRGHNMVEELGCWLPAIDSCQPSLADKVRLFRDVLGSRAAKAASEKGATP